MRFSRQCLLATLLCGFAGCTVGPDYHEPTPWYSPASWFGGTPPAQKISTLPDASMATIEPVNTRWWESFNDPELTTLERRIAAEDLDLRVAASRLSQARAQLGITGADQFAQLNGNTSYTREKESAKGVLSLFPSTGGSGRSSPGAQSNGLGGTNGGIPNTGSTSLSNPFDLFQYGLDASWEIDFWGRVRRELEAARAQVVASQEDQRNALVSAEAELARDYIQLRGVQQDISITEQNLRTEQDSLNLTQQRAVGGLATDLDVQNQTAQVEQTRSQLPNQRAQEAQLINAMAQLLSQPPDALDAELETPEAIPPVPPVVPVGLPSDLLRRRPDIREAEQNLHAATADVGVAVASFYPTITLSGSVAIQTLQFKDLGSWALGNTYSAGPSITLPIFQGGRLTRTLELRKGQQEQAGLQYQQTVLTALHEVNNALTAYAEEQNRQVALRRSVEANRRAVGLARDRYAAGLSTFLDVLDAERQLLATQQQQTDSQTAISTDLVQLFKALGGGWEADFPEVAEPKPPLIPVAIVQP